MKIKFLLAGLLCLNALSAAAAAKKEEMTLVPSVWAAWMRGSVNVNGQQAEIARTADDYFDNMDYGFSGELVLRNSQMVLLGFIDYFDTISSDVTVGSQKGTLDSSEIIGGIAIGSPLSSGKTTVDVLVGLQTLRLDNMLALNGGGAQSDSTVVYDLVLMLRIKQELMKNLYLNIPLTVGGMYLSDSDFVYDAGVQLLYQLTDKFDVRAGYRIAGYDLSEGSGSTDFYQQGYTLGLGIEF